MQVKLGAFKNKIQINKEVIYTRAKNPHLNVNLTYLEDYITTVNSNIETFNPQVKVNVELLKVRD